MPDEVTDVTAMIKTIAETVDVNISSSDIESAYRVKRNKKIIVMFATLTKKKELLGKLKGRRIDRSVVWENSQEDNINKYIYINDELTANNRRLLWLAKTKAKEHNWKFVWVRNGYIYARKNENTSPIIITNSADIESITETI